MRNDFLPIFAPRIGHRSSDHAEIATGIVDPNIKEIAVVVRVVLDVLFTRFDDFPFGHGLVGGNKTRFAGGVTADDEQQIGFAASLASANRKPFVFFLVEEVVGAGRADSMAIQLIGPFSDCVFHSIENCFVVVGPGHGLAALSMVDYQLGAAEGFYAQRTSPVASVV